VSTVPEVITAWYRFVSEQSIVIHLIKKLPVIESQDAALHAEDHF
jgi:hypothetical protein